MVLEEAPPGPPSEPGRRSQLLVLSAKSRLALDEASTRLSDHLERHPELNLADVGYTLQVGRQAMPQRRFIVACDTAEAVGVRSKVCLSTL